MTRRVFFSFHYDQDAWRTNQLRNAGVVTGNKPISANRWEEIRRTGDRAIQHWIDSEIAKASCTIVLIGTHTAERHWVRYEIAKSWRENKGIFGVCIHRLLDRDGQPSSRGGDPFSRVHPDDFLKGHSLEDVVSVYSPRGTDSRAVYAHITHHIAEWVEVALIQRDLRTSDTNHE